ncbi:MAG: hypothetical protein RBG13Loki_1285 [Promethearchaeota archaeon CR_4]|nr:MAG: hypothetical protein RBG13Loki_1285 [Candidatus Lokiarchaeota archaeon CR_4]
MKKSLTVVEGEKEGLEEEFTCPWLILGICGKEFLLTYLQRTPFIRLVRICPSPKYQITENYQRNHCYVSVYLHVLPVLGHPNNRKRGRKYRRKSLI